MHRLLSALFLGELKGGDRLIEVDLAERFGVSRTPVREALLELGVLGLVEMRANRGGVVREFGPRQLSDLYAVRAVLEGEAVRLAHDRLPGPLLDDMRQRLERLLALRGPLPRKSCEQGLALDRELHDAIAAICGNSMLAGEIRRYRRLADAVRECLNHEPAVHRRAAEQHLTLVKVLQGGDAQEASELMRQHVLDCADVAGNRLFKHRRRPAANGVGSEK